MQQSSSDEVQGAVSISSSAVNDGQECRNTYFSGTTSVSDCYNVKIISAFPCDVLHSLNVAAVLVINQTSPLKFVGDGESALQKDAVLQSLDWQHSTSNHQGAELNSSGGSVQKSSQSSHEERAENKKSRGRPSQRAGIKLCEVCGDLAKSYHFGGLSCNSCKAFFRRSVQNDMYLQFYCCRGRQNCTIMKSNRKRCQHCRMKKCFEVGMQKRWVLTDEEKKTRAEKKNGKLESSATSVVVQNAAQQTSAASPRKDCFSNHIPDFSRMIDSMSRAEIKEINSAVTKYTEAFKRFPYRAELFSGNVNRPGFQVMEILGTVFKGFALYARMFENFTSLSSQDQMILLEGSMLEMCLLRGAFAFDPVNNRWPRTDISVYKDAPVISVDDVKKLVSSSVIEKHLKFIHALQNSGADESSVMLLLLVVLFSSRPGLSHPDAVENSQTRYTSLLKRYVDWRFGPGRSQKLFIKLLTKLADLRELSETHNSQNLYLGKVELTSIQQQLNDIKINPFPGFNIFNDDVTKSVEWRHEDMNQTSSESQQKTLTSESMDNRTNQFLEPKDHHLSLDIESILSSQHSLDVLSPVANRYHEQFKNISMDIEAESRWSRELGSIGTIASGVSLSRSDSADSHLPDTGPSGFAEVQFMDMLGQSIHKKIDRTFHEPLQVQTDDAICDVDVTNESAGVLLPALSGDQPFSPPSLDADSYDAWFELHDRNAECRAETASNEKESKKEEEVVTDQVCISEEKMLDEVYRELVKYSESFCK